MSTQHTIRPAIVIAAMLVGTTAVGGAATAGPLAAGDVAVASGHAQSHVQEVRRGRGGIGIYIDPGYGYDRGYGYYDDGYDYDYYPRRRSYYDDGYYDRRYRKHSRRWVKERFEHPLGRR